MARKQGEGSIDAYNQCDFSTPKKFENRDPMSSTFHEHMRRMNENKDEKLIEDSLMSVSGGAGNRYAHSMRGGDG